MHTHKQKCCEKAINLHWTLTNAYKHYSFCARWCRFWLYLSKRRKQHTNPCEKAEEAAREFSSFSLHHTTLAFALARAHVLRRKTQVWMSRYWMDAVCGTWFTLFSSSACSYTTYYGKKGLSKCVLLFFTLHTTALFCAILKTILYTDTDTWTRT